MGLMVHEFIKVTNKVMFTALDSLRFLSCDRIVHKIESTLYPIKSQALLKHRKHYDATGIKLIKFFIFFVPKPYSFSYRSLYRI